MLKQVTIGGVDYDVDCFRIAEVMHDWWVDDKGRVRAPERGLPLITDGPRLIVRPIPPQLVPLGPEDVIPGTAIRNVAWRPSYYELITPSVCGKGVYRMPSSNPTFEVLKWEQMAQSDWTYKTPTMPEWQRCSKPA